MSRQNPAYKPAGRTGFVKIVLFMQEFVMDAFDRTLLLALRSDSAMSNEALADRVGLSASQCYRRRLRLEKSGHIRGYRAVVDPRNIGFTVGAFIHVGIVGQSTHQRKKLAAFLAGQPGFLSCHAVTGDADYIMRVEASDLSGLNELLTLLLAQGSDRMHVKSLVVLDTIKDT